MKRVTRNGVIAVAAASGALGVAVPAYADAGADAAAVGSPGIISGNTVQLPVHTPVNVCGNTVTAVGLLNSAGGNTCVNEDGAEGTADGTSQGSPDGAGAEGAALDSAGVLSGNGVQLPVDVPVNVTGNSVDVAGVGNAAEDNTSMNTSGDEIAEPPAPERSTPPRTAADPAPEHAPQTTGALAETGADHTLPVVATGAALFLGGVALYRRFRPGRDN